MTLFDDPEAPPAEPAPVKGLGPRTERGLDWLRRRMKVIYNFRCNDIGTTYAYVTIDDARVLVKFRSRFDQVLGELFQGDGWKLCGRKVKSRVKDAPDVEAWKYEG